jgi:hypothetical protein
LSCSQHPASDTSPEPNLSGSNPTTTTILLFYSSPYITTMQDHRVSMSSTHQERRNLRKSVFRNRE